MNWINIFESIDEINTKIELLSEGSRIVYTYGAWDIFHPGHVNLLIRARNLGDFLIVGVVSDRPISELKGETRPIQSEEDRLIIVGGLRCVDAAIIQPLYNPSRILRKLVKIDILTKGDDWDYIPGEKTIRDLGGELVKLGYTENYSSSNLISKIIEQ